MKIATWNVNGVNGRLPVLLRWLEQSAPDVACLQEIKTIDDGFPREAIEKAGYGAVWHGQKAYNGVAILARGEQPQETGRGLPGDEADVQSRYLEADVMGIRIACIYLPNGNPQPGPKFDYKLAWCERLIQRAQALVERKEPVVIAGDFNIVPTDAVMDIYNPKSWRNDALLQPQSRAAWQSLLGQGWTDAIATLRAGGLSYEGRPYQGTWVGQFDGDALVGVVMHAWNGNVILQAPDDAAALAVAVVAASDRPVAGLIGPWSQVVAARAVIGLPRPAPFDQREDLFDLELTKFVEPAPLDSIAWRVAEDHDLGLLAAWRHDNCVESQGATPGDALLAEVTAQLARSVGERRMFVLEDAKVPVACSSFNAQLPDCVQIGAVYTPPSRRGRGYARRVVAGSLVHARTLGVTRSILFTGDHNEPARRAYLALGYEIVGDYGLVIW